MASRLKKMPHRCQQIHRGGHPTRARTRDFWNRIRAFPLEVAGWRKRLLRELAANPGRFSLASRLTPAELQEKLDSGISHMREVARILAVLYGSPDLQNKADPTDELVYIILARKTREGAYQRGFDALKKRFRTWDRLLDAPRAEVEKLVFSGGLSGKKSRACTALWERSARPSAPARWNPPATGRTRSWKPSSAHFRKSSEKAPTA